MIPRTLYLYFNLNIYNIDINADILDSIEVLQIYWNSCSSVKKPLSILNNSLITEQRKPEFAHNFSFRRKMLYSSYQQYMCNKW